MRYLCALIALPTLLTSGLSAYAATILYGSNVAVVDEVLADPTDLWIRPSELKRVNGFELKPEGACLDEICVPVRQDENSEIFITRSDGAWFNLVGLATRVAQPFVVDHEEEVWSFGAIPTQRTTFVKQGLAPDFELPGIDGRH
jgi:hypothetical protein